MSFGFSIGDFIAVYQLVVQIRKEFVDAPTQFKAISEELRSLSIVLQDVDVIVDEQELSSQQKTKLHDIANGCRSVLDKLEKTVDKYRELKSDPECIGKKVKRVWKRLKWEPEDIKELRDRINSNIALLTAFDSQLTRSGVAKLVQHHDNQERQTILNWLTQVDYSSQQSDLIGRRQEGSGQWLLDSNEFQRWLNQSNQTLFCPGIPGAGKTIISSIVVDLLWNKFQSEPNIGIAYLYCNYRRQQEQKAIDLVLSLTKQLAQKQLLVPAEVKNLYEHCTAKPNRPSLNEIAKVLQSTVRLYSRVFIIIDALDECDDSNEGRNRLISEVLSLQGQAPVNLFATSRFVPEIASQFKGCVSMEIRAKDGDVLRYVNGRIPQLLRSRISRYPDLQDAIRREIVAAADGMFLLAQLHMDALLSKPTPGAVRLALRDLPRGVRGLDTMYEQAIKRINGLEEDFRQLAKQVLSWVIHAWRPLTTAELQHALAVRESTVELDEDFIPEVEDLISVCAGLVTIDEKSTIVRWIHYTTQEYFQRTWTLWVPQAEDYIASACLTYLSFNAFAAGYCQTEEDLDALPRLNIFYEYAAQNWGHHARLASTEVEQSFLSLLENEAKVSSVSQVMGIPKPRGYYFYPNLPFSDMAPRQVTGVHLAAHFGLAELMITLLNKHNPNVQDAYGHTPLWYAAGEGHTAVVKLLLTQEGIDVDSKDNEGQTPLSWVAWGGKESVVKLLLTQEGVDADSKDNKGHTPLWYAAGEGHIAVVKLLLTQEGIDVDSKDVKGRTPLSWAAERGQESVAKLLLTKEGVDADSKDNEGRTPLSYATWGGEESVVKLLLTKEGVDVDSKDNEGRTPLSWAAPGGKESVVKLLLTKEGVNVDSKDNQGRTPLSLAASCRKESVVKLLLTKKGVDANSKDSKGWTPLTWAAWGGKESVVKLLLTQEGVDADSRDNEDRTPLSWAAWGGKESVVKLLLTQEGVDADSKDNEGRTPLSWAVWGGKESVVKLLLTKEGVDANSKDNEGQTPLSWAASGRKESVVKLLLTKEGVNVDSRDNKGRTPLSLAAPGGKESVVKLLLTKEGVDANSKDNEGWTPLNWAVWGGKESVVKLLLTKGVEADSKDNKGRTPLWYAAGEGHIAVVKLLLEAKVNLNEKSEFGATALHLAARNGRETVANLPLLLENGGIDLDCKDKHDRTPLLRAAEHGHEAIVRLLAEKGATVNTQERCFGKALQVMAYSDRHVTLQSLMEMGISVDPQNDWLGDALQLGCIKGHTVIVEQLLRLGADPNNVDEHGWSPISCASRFHHVAILDNLVLAGGDKNLLSNVNTLPPTSWSGTNKSTHLKLDESGVCVTYIGVVDDTETTPPAATVLANHPVPFQNTSFYFEITILDSGETSMIGVGFSNKFVDLDGFPGWGESSWAYHGDDGMAHGDDTSKPYGETFGTGDVIGCQVSGEGELSFTKNGTALGVAFDHISGQFYPAVGIQSCGAKIRANFGSENFRYRGNVKSREELD